MEHTPESLIEELNKKINEIRPSYYKSTNGIEVIEIINGFNLGFNLGNCIKYILRCENKGNKKEDLEKAMTYLKFEIDKTK